MPFDSTPQTDDVRVLLTAAKHVISSPSKWIKFMIADRGERFCAIGAVYMAGEANPHCQRAITLLHTIAQQRGYGGGVGEFNDHETTNHDGIMAFFDEAINSL